MRIILLGGNSPNQLSLAHRIQEKYKLVGAITVQKKAKTPSINEVFDELRFAQIEIAWHKAMQKLGKKYAAYPNIPRIEVADVNDLKVFEFVQKMNPDLILVSGTGIIRPPLLDISLPIGMLNWHPGLVPFVKGNPEPTNWCLAEGNFHLIGNSIIWLDAGVDTGAVLCSDFVNFTTEKTLADIYYATWKQGQDLVLDTLEYLQNNKAPFQKVPQKKLGGGKTYRKKMWSNEKKKYLLHNVRAGNFVNAIHSFEFQELRKKTPTVSLPSKIDNQTTF